MLLALMVYSPRSPVAQAATLMGRDMRLAVSLVAPPQGATRMIAVPFHRQEHSLSCEIASLRSALLALHIDVPEYLLFTALPMDDTPKRVSSSGDMTWGDPDRGFVGNINGKMPSTGYGVHAPPIVEMAKHYYVDAAQIRADDAAALIRAVDAGHPVIVWFPIGSDPRPMSWRTPDGRLVQAALYEHTAVVNGYRADANGGIEEIHLVDPLTGERSEPWDEYIRRTAMLGNQAVVLSPKFFVVKEPR